jgi:hypothetical protein
VRHRPDLLKRLRPLLRPLPNDLRLGRVARFRFQKREVSKRVEDILPPLPVTRIGGHKVLAVGDLNPVDRGAVGAVHGRGQRAPISGSCQGQQEKDSWAKLALFCSSRRTRHSKKCSHPTPAAGRYCPRAAVAPAPLPLLGSIRRRCHLRFPHTKCQTSTGPSALSSWTTSRLRPATGRPDA